MKVDEKRLIARAKGILDKNWKGGFTVPSARLYPHQWSWDSAFIAMGYAHYDLRRAQDELLSIFEGQWKNGMLPHIVFRSRDSYFPGPERWQISVSPNAPEMETSALTHPAMHAIAALKIYQKAADKASAKAFLEEIFPKLMAFHKYLFTSRDPEKTGLITIFHPWESGLDNSVRWDDALARIKLEKKPSYKRIDIEKVRAEERPSDETYDKFIYLIELMRECRYDDEKIYEKTPFKIKDVVFSSIAYQANKALLEIAGILGKPGGNVSQWISRTRQNYFSFFCPEKTEYRMVYDYDLVTGEIIEKRTAASLLSLYTDLLSKKQAETTVEWLKHSSAGCEKCTHQHPAVPSIDFHDAYFDPLNSWRGPIWVNINWMLYQGMKHYGFDQRAQMLRSAVLELVDEHGFYEYYNPLNGDGLGANDFSWTGALVIDLLNEKEG